MSLAADCPVQSFDEIDSTNSEAVRRAATGVFEDVWITARLQTGGRGRLGRQWLSPPGNLYATALFRMMGSLQGASHVPFAAGLAVHDALASFIPDAEVRLKWPNDVRVDGAKLAGILVEAGELKADVWVAAGFGINILHAPEGAGQPVCSLASLRGDDCVTGTHVLDALRKAFASRLSQLSAGFALTRKDWLLQAEGLGQCVRISARNSSLEGIFEDMADDGTLKLRLPDGSTRTISTGDVELIKEVG